MTTDKPTPDPERPTGASIESLRGDIMILRETWEMADHQVRAHMRLVAALTELERLRAGAVEAEEKHRGEVITANWMNGTLAAERDSLRAERDLLAKPETNPEWVLLAEDHKRILAELAAERAKREEAERWLDESKHQREGLVKANGILKARADAAEARCEALEARVEDANTALFGMCNDGTGACPWCRAQVVPRHPGERAREHRAYCSVNNLINFLGRDPAADLSARDARIRREEREAAAAKVDELAALIRLLVHSLRKHSPDNETARKAVDYLKRNELQGSPLRTTILSPAPDAASVQPSASRPPQGGEGGEK